jgi:predicted naringenin-chalcone synthase
MGNRGSVSFEKDRTLVEVMALGGEAVEVIDDYLECLDLSDGEREELRRVARRDTDATVEKVLEDYLDPPPADIASGDVIAMNPLTSQPQRAAPR